MSHYDSIVIGSGYAGMSYASLLSKFGKKVLIIEKNGYLGGRAASRKASEWGWHGSGEIIAYGPHIVPAKAYAEKLLDILGIKDRLSLEWTNIPFLHKDGIIIKVPTRIHDFVSNLRLFWKLKDLPIREKWNLVSLMRMARSTSITGIIERYEGISVLEMCDKHGLRSRQAYELIGVITGSTVQTLDFRECPALDVVIMFKLMLNGIDKVRTIMYNTTKGYSKIFSEMEKAIARKGGKVVKNREARRLVVEGEEVKGVYLGGRKVLADHVVFNGVPRDFKRLLDGSGLKSGFLKALIDLGPAVTTDLIVVTKKRIFDTKSEWVYPLKALEFPSRKFGYVIIQEGVGLKDRYLYHICTNSFGVVGRKEIETVKKDIEKDFGMSIDKDAEWSVVKRLPVVGTKKSVKIPFSKRLGPETPFRNLFVIGDSYKALTTGTDGCAYSALDLAGKVLGKDFGIDEFCK